MCPKEPDAAASAGGIAVHRTVYAASGAKAAFADAGAFGQMLLLCRRWRACKLLLW